MECLSCGACCAYFRVSFYWKEAEVFGIPKAMTEPLPPFRFFMKGTGGIPPRCVALTGEIGGAVACSIYGARPSVCRDFAVSWENGVPNPRCDAARIAYGLPPIMPAAPTEPDNRPTTPSKPPKVA